MLVPTPLEICIESFLPFLIVCVLVVHHSTVVAMEAVATTALQYLCRYMSPTEQETWSKMVEPNNSLDASSVCVTLAVIPYRKVIHRMLWSN